MEIDEEGDIAAIWHEIVSHGQHKPQASSNPPHNLEQLVDTLLE